MVKPESEENAVSLAEMINKCRRLGSNINVGGRSTGNDEANLKITIGVKKTHAKIIGGAEIKLTETSQKAT
jgi:hypothetical protein